jgi:hypothetical protein
MVQGLLTKIASRNQEIAHCELTIAAKDRDLLYRQKSIFARAGMALARSTLAQWVGVCGVQLQPLVDALKDDTLRHAVLHADETPKARPPPGHLITASSAGGH